MGTYSRYFYSFTCYLFVFPLLLHSVYLPSLLNIMILFIFLFTFYPIFLIYFFVIFLMRLILIDIIILTIFITIILSCVLFIVYISLRISIVSSNGLNGHFCFNSLFFRNQSPAFSPSFTIHFVPVYSTKDFKKNYKNLQWDKVIIQQIMELCFTGNITVSIFFVF